jgi:hypothetical protein
LRRGSGLDADRVWTNGTIRRVVDVSAHYGHNVPTAITRHGVFYLGNLGLFDPADQAGDEHVYQLKRNGRIRVRARGLEKVLGLAFRGGKLYALDGAFYVSEQGFGFPAGEGRVIRITTGHHH